MINLDRFEKFRKLKETHPEKYWYYCGMVQGIYEFGFTALIGLLCGVIGVLIQTYFSK